MPVGSSAKMRSGRLIRARAQAQRCCWPPESSVGRCDSRSRDAQLGDEVVEPLLVDLLPRQVGRQGDVLAGGQRGHQVERLEHEADPVAPQLGEPLVVEASDVEVAHEAVPRGRPVEAGHAVHQGGLARSRRAHDGREAAAVEGDVDPGQRVDGRLPGAVGLAQLDGVRRRGGRTLGGRDLVGERHGASFRRRGKDAGGRGAAPTVSPLIGDVTGRARPLLPSPWTTAVCNAGIATLGAPPAAHYCQPRTSRTALPDRHVSDPGGPVRHGDGA